MVRRMRSAMATLRGAAFLSFARSCGRELPQNLPERITRTSDSKAIMP